MIQTHIPAYPVRPRGERVETYAGCAIRRKSLPGSRCAAGKTRCPTATSKIATISAMRLPQNGPGAPHRANSGADASGNNPPPRNLNPEKDDDAILRGRSVALSAASVNKVFVVPCKPPITMIPTMTTTKLCVLKANTVIPPAMSTSTTKMDGTSPKYFINGPGAMSEKIARALPQPKNTTPSVNEEYSTPDASAAPANACGA